LDWPAVNLYAIHPGGAKILSACEEALSITKHDNRYAYEVLRNFGNMSSATILFVLKNLINDISADEQNKTVLSCAFGPGLTIHAMLLKVQHV
jgi:predicted naringenin-chalcone synthase